MKFAQTTALVAVSGIVFCLADRAVGVSRLPESSEVAIRGALLDGFFQQCVTNSAASNCTEQNSGACKPTCLPNRHCYCCVTSYEPDSCEWALSAICHRPSSPCGNCNYVQCVEVTEPAGWVCPISDCLGAQTEDDCTGTIRDCNYN